MKKTILLGATGSIGSNVIEIALRYPEKFKLDVLVGNSNLERLAEFAKKCGAKIAGISSKEGYYKLKDLLQGTNIKIVAGSDEIKSLFLDNYDLGISAISGSAGLEYTYALIPSCKTLAIANKESMVCAGEFITASAKENGTKLLPIDSEHTSLLQIIQHEELKALKHITLTASGGAFRDLPREAIVNMPASAALKHPNWSMGNKITIDSATLANKGLEVIEAMQFFNLSRSQIKVLMHRESIIHAMSSYIDGTTLAHMGLPDMKTSIAYSMNYPERFDVGVPELDLAKLQTLNFSNPDLQKFPMLELALEVSEAGPEIRTIYNLCNEDGVARYLANKIGFYDIYNNAVKFIQSYKTTDCKNIYQLFDIINTFNNYTL